MFKSTDHVVRIGIRNHWIQGFWLNAGVCVRVGSSAAEVERVWLFDQGQKGSEGDSVAVGGNKAFQYSLWSLVSPHSLTHTPLLLLDTRKCVSLAGLLYYDGVV